MTSRGKNKRDSSVLDDIPDFIIDHERLDITKKCLRFSKLIDNVQEATLKDLDGFQIELEFLLTDAMKRMHLLKNEFRASRELKTNKNFDDRLKKIKDLNNEKFQANKITAKNKSNKVKRDVIDFILKTQISSKNNSTCQIWNYCEKYDMILKDLNPFLGFLKSSLPVNIPNNVNSNSSYGKSPEEIKDLLGCLSFNKLVTKSHSKRVKLGPYTERLCCSFIPIEGSSCKDETLDEANRYIERSKKINQSDANFIEKSIYSDLVNLKLANSPIESSGDGYLNELKHQLVSQNEANSKIIQHFRKLTEKELAKPQIYRIMQEEQLGSIEKFKQLLVSINSDSVSESEVEYFKRILDRKLRLVSFAKKLYR